MSTQKVVIPKGLINPHETTIVEIPKNLQNASTVVARPKAADPNRQLSKTLPKYKAKPFKALHDEGTSFAGRPCDSSMEESRQESRQESYAPPRRRTRLVKRSGDLSEGDISYGVGRSHDEGWRGFNPPVNEELQSTFQDLDYREGSLYRDFRPKKASSRPTSPARTPTSMRHYHSSLGTVSPTTSQEEEEEEEEEEDYYEDEVYEPPPAPEGRDSGAYKKYDLSSSCDSKLCSSPTSADYKKYYDLSSSGGSGAYNVSSGKGPTPRSAGGTRYRRWDSTDSEPGTPPPPAMTPKPITQREVMNSLGDLESVELSQIMDDLSEFQNARRRLVFDASSLATASDVSSSLLSSSG